MFPALKGLVLQRDRGNGAVLAIAALVLSKGARAIVVAVRKAYAGRSVATACVGCDAALMCQAPTRRWQRDPSVTVL